MYESIGRNHRHGPLARQERTLSVDKLLPVNNGHNLNSSLESFNALKNCLVRKGFEDIQVHSKSMLLLYSFYRSGARTV